MHKPAQDETQRFAAILAECKREHAALKAQWADITAELGDVRAPGSVALDALIDSLPLRERRALRRFHDETLALTQDTTPGRPAPSLALPRFFANALRG